MRKIALLLFASLALACNENSTKKKNGFDYNRTKKEETKSSQKKQLLPSTSTTLVLAQLLTLVFPLRLMKQWP